MKKDPRVYLLLIRDGLSAISWYTRRGGRAFV